MSPKRRPRTPPKTCPFCREGFAPDYRHDGDQKACNKETCQRQRHSQATATWKKNNPEKVRDYYAKYVKPWRERRRKLEFAASSSCSETSRLAPWSPRVHQARDQIYACVCGCFESLERELNLASALPVAAPAEKKHVLGDACTC